MQNDQVEVCPHCGQPADRAEALRRWRGLHDGIVEMTPLEWKRKKKAERARRARAERTRKSKRRRK